VQQHEEQLEQSAGVWQVAQDVSPQPHVWQADDEDPNTIANPKPISHAYLFDASSSSDSRLGLDTE